MAWPRQPNQIERREPSWLRLEWLSHFRLLGIVIFLIVLQGLLTLAPDWFPGLRTSEEWSNLVRLVGSIEYAAVAALGLGLVVVIALNALDEAIGAAMRIRDRFR